MLLRIISIILIGLGSLVSSRIIEQWPVLSDEKSQPEFVFDFGPGGVIDRGTEWSGRYYDVKPVKEVQRIIVTEKVPFPYPVNGYLTYSSEESVPYPAGVEKDLPLPYPVKKIIRIPVSSRVIEKPPNVHHVVTTHRHPIPHSHQIVKVPAQNKISLQVPHDVHLSEHLPDPYSLERNLLHGEVPYSFPVHINVPVSSKTLDSSNNQVSKTIILENGRPYFTIYLVPYAVDKSPNAAAAVAAAENHVKHEAEDNLNEHAKPAYYSSIKPQETRSQLYSVTHKLYSNLSEEKKPPQVVDFNHPIDHGEE